MRTIPQPLAGQRIAVLTVLLGGLTAFGPLSMDLYLPTFPGLAADLGASQAAVQFTLTADVIVLVVGQVVLGPLSDARGRRRLLIGSTLVCAMASVLCALAPSVGWLTVWRFLQGAAGGGGIVLARAVAADVASGVAAARLFSLFMTVSSVAPIAAPVLGGALLAATGSWRPMFWLLAAISLLLAVATSRAIPETLPPERRHTGGLRSTGRAFIDLARDRVFAGYALVVLVAAGFGVLAVLAPLFLVVASRGLVSANATVLGVKRASAAGAASAVLGACMFGGGILVSPLIALGGEGTAIPMAAVVAGGAVAALLATVLLTRGDHPEPVDANAGVAAQPIKE